MSRIGKLPIEIPGAVTVKVDHDTVIVEGPEGTLNQSFEARYVGVSVDDGKVVVNRLRESKAGRARHGLYRSLIANMVEGVQKPYQKSLILNGLGYKVEVQGQKVILDVGFAGSKTYMLPDGVSGECPTPTEIVVKGIDKQKVGAAAASIRSVRKPEPYNGTGIRYRNEVVRRKAGKLAA
jgi:large subunit ribosomal protein L6